MADYQLLNNVDHASLRVITSRGARYGDDVMFAPTYPSEMRSIQACYPVLIRKDDSSGQLHPVAMFGFEEGENLFLDGDTWNAPYIPVMIRRQPFLIGFHKQSPGTEGQRVVTIDVEHPRVSESEGLALFQEHGGNSEFLEYMADMLETIHRGNEQNKLFMDMLVKYSLVHEITIDVTLKDQSRNQLQGFYTIDDQKLQQLDAEALGDLNSRGCLLPAYMMVASQSHLARLVDLRNLKLKSQ
jgi:hypothetical protein